jgi:hypothetical protein
LALSFQDKLQFLQDTDRHDPGGHLVASLQAAEWALKLQRMAAPRRLTTTSIGGGAMENRLSASPQNLPLIKSPAAYCQVPIDWASTC